MPQSYPLLVQICCLVKLSCAPFRTCLVFPPICLAQELAGLLIHTPGLAAQPHSLVNKEELSTSDKDQRRLLVHGHTNLTKIEASRLVTHPPHSGTLDLGTGPSRRVNRLDSALTSLPSDASVCSSCSLLAHIAQCSLLLNKDPLHPPQ